eukprot:gene5439-6939_t
MWKDKYQKLLTEMRVDTMPEVVDQALQEAEKDSEAFRSDNASVHTLKSAAIAQASSAVSVSPPSPSLSTDIF